MVLPDSWMASNYCTRRSYHSNPKRLEPLSPSKGSGVQYNLHHINLIYDDSLVLYDDNKFKNGILPAGRAELREKLLNCTMMAFCCWFNKRNHLETNVSILFEGFYTGFYLRGLWTQISSCCCWQFLEVKCCDSEIICLEPWLL